jgi:hypothetical protein
MPQGCSLVGSESQSQASWTSVLRARLLPAIDASIAIHAAALKRRWGKTQIAGDLPPVVERPVEHLPRQDGGEVHADSADRAKRFDRSACGVVLRFQSLLANGVEFADHF